MTIRQIISNYNTIIKKRKQIQLIYSKEEYKMDYYRTQDSDGMLPSTSADSNLLNMASDSYAPDYWNIPYTNGLSPMKQIEGKTN